MTILEGLDLPDRQFSVFCMEPLLPKLGGVLAPSIGPLIVDYFTSIWQLYMIMMAVELTEYCRNYIVCSTNASSSSSTAKSCWGTPSSSRSILIVLIQGILNDLLSHFTICNAMLSQRSHILCLKSLFGAHRH